MAEETRSRALRALHDIVQSGRPLAYVRSAEEQRITALLREAATVFFSPPAPLWIWTLTEGMRRDGGKPDGKVIAPGPALDFVAAHDGPGIFLFKDFHEPMRETPEIRRRLRDLYEACLDRRKLLLRCSPVEIIPDAREPDLVFV